MNQENQSPRVQFGSSKDDGRRLTTLPPSEGGVSSSKLRTAHSAMTYAEKLRDPRWRATSLRIRRRDGWKCIKCGTTRRRLDVHHTRYLPKRDPWDYPDHMMVTLCRPCHEDQHTETPAPPEPWRYEPGADPVLDCHACGEGITVDAVAGRNGKHEPLCETCCMESE